jgi:hypothetical protein
VLDRAGADPSSRAQLLDHPGEEISGLLGIPLPESVAIRVIEEQAGEVVLVLPAQARQSRTALSEAKLEKVAGGSAVSWLLLNAQCIG